MPDRVPTYRPPGRPPGRTHSKPTGDQVERFRFYKRRSWLVTRRAKLADNPLCERCQAEGRLTPAEDVHHIQPLAKRPDLGLDLGNLESLCGPCHTREERRRRRDDGG